MKRNVFIKMTACGLAATLTVGGVSVMGVNASPTAGLSTYTSNVVTSSILPTAGLSLAMTQCVAAVEDEATVAKAQPEVKENDTPVVASEYADLAVATVDDYVNVRKKPNTDSKVVGKLYKNNVGTVLGTKGDWYKIKSGNVTGYVKRDYVAVDNEKLAKKAGRRIAVVTTETLKVRKGASSKDEVMTLVPGGEDLTVIDESVDGWVGVSVEEGDGYVSADYVELSTEYTYAESRAEEKARLKKEEEERKAAEEAARQEGQVQEGGGGEARRRGQLRRRSRQGQTREAAEEEKVKPFTGPQGPDPSRCARAETCTGIQTHVAVYGTVPADLCTRLLGYLCGRNIVPMV